MPRWIGAALANIHAAIGNGLRKSENPLSVWPCSAKPYRAFVCLDDLFTAALMRHRHCAALAEMFAAQLDQVTRAPQDHRSSAA